jgi:hypothetical protein
MAKGSNIVHQYYKKEFEAFTIIVKVNPYHFTGTEITIPKQGEPSVRELQFDEDIFEDLKADGFTTSSPLEFNLYYSGLAGSTDEV